MRLRFLTGTFLNSNSQQWTLRRSNFTTELTQRTTNPRPPLLSQELICTQLLQICQEQCKRIKTRNSFDEMPQRTTQALRTGKLIHAQSLKLYIPKGLLENAIVDLYAKCGNVGFAEKAFKMLDKRDVFAWNSIMSMYSRNGLTEQILKCFVSLHESNVLGNEFTFAIALSACSRLMDVACGRQLHCSVVKTGHCLSSFCVGSLIDMYAKCHALCDARQVFDEAVNPDTVSWTSMISGYVQLGFPEEALKVFEQMQKVGHVPDQVTFVTVINACVSLGRLDDACGLFAQMPNPNVVAWNVMISGYAKMGYEHEATKFFQNMRKSSVKSTRSTLGSVLSAIASLGDIELGLVVHAEAMKQGLASNVYVGSSLISMYAKSDKMESAKKVFDGLDEKNIVLWNAMLGGHAQDGNAYEVMQMYSDMKYAGFHPDEFTFTSILSACASLEYLQMGCQLHGVILKNNFTSNLYVGNALVDMYAKSGALEDARKQFELIRNRDNISWNAIIVGYVQEEDEVEAFDMFRRMNLSYFTPDEACLASILSACANVKSLGKGKQVHCISFKIGLDTRLYAGSSLIDMYAKCGASSDARKVFSCMENKSIVSMNALIAGYSQTDFEEAVALFREMQAEGLTPTKITFASLLDECKCNTHRLDLGKQIHCLVIKRGLLIDDDDFLKISLLGMYISSCRNIDSHTLFLEFPNPKSKVLWTAIISGHTQNDLNEEALTFYREMHRNDVLPDQATFVSVLRACAISSALREGRLIHSLVFHTGYHLDELTSSALVDMYAKCGDVKSSLQTFEEMINKNNTISWNSMIVGFAKNGYAEDAVAIFNTMRQTQVTPDDVTFLGVLTACSHSGKVFQGREIFDMMVSYYRIQPRVDHCACMVDLLGRWGYLKEAEEFIEKLNVEPDPMIWATLLGACRIHGDDIRGRRAAEKLIELEPKNSSSYVLLSNIYAASGNWDEVNVLRREMRERGVKKVPGCSWIVVGRKTHMFVAGDELHPSTNEIFSTLKDLNELMKKDDYAPELEGLGP